MSTSDSVAAVVRRPRPPELDEPRALPEGTYPVTPPDGVRLRPGYQLVMVPYNGDPGQVSLHLARLAEGDDCRLIDLWQSTGHLACGPRPADAGWLPAGWNCHWWPVDDGPDAVSAFVDYGYGVSRNDWPPRDDGPLPPGHLQAGWEPLAESMAMLAEKVGMVPSVPTVPYEPGDARSFLRCLCHTFRKWVAGERAERSPGSHHPEQPSVVRVAPAGRSGLRPDQRFVRGRVVADLTALDQLLVGLAETVSAGGDRGTPVIDVISAMERQQGRKYKDGMKSFHEQKRRTNGKLQGHSLLLEQINHFLILMENTRT